MIRPLSTLLLLLACAGIQAQGTLDKALLDVSIKTFDMNLPESVQAQQQQDIYPAVRQAEARYLPSFLKLVMQESGQWGAVRLLPETDSGAELQITATIVNSDGRRLDLAFTARDSTGRVWADKLYQGTAVESVSLSQPTLATDAFLYLYSEISAELVAVYNSLSDTEVDEIKKVAMLRYASSLAPDAFQDFLKEDESGQLSLSRFPAENDPALLRIQEIREHEYVFIDVVDAQYEDFFVSIKPVYDLWRRYRRKQQDSETGKINREARQGTEFRRGSYMSLRESYNNFRWARMQDQYLDEINEGFTNEILPTDITLEDSLYHLSGTLDEQYDEWRGILKELYMLDGSVEQ